MKLSEIPIDKLKETSWLHNVDLDKLRSFEDYAAWLEAILHNPCNVWEEDGEMPVATMNMSSSRFWALRSGRVAPRVGVDSCSLLFCQQSASRQ